jgi:hypothetical protein
MLFSKKSALRTTGQPVIAHQATILGVALRKNKQNNNFCRIGARFVVFVTN